MQQFLFEINKHDGSDAISFTGSRKGVHEFAIKQIVENFDKFPIKFPYYLDRETGYSSGRKMLSFESRDIEHPVSGTLPDGRTLYMDYRLSAKPDNLCAALTVLLEKAGWRVNARIL